MSYPALTGNNFPAVPLVQRSIAAASIGASYSLVGSIFNSPVIMIIITGDLDQAVQLSLDGTNDWLPFFPGDRLVLDEKSNGLVLAAWRGLYVKEIGNPATGNLYVSGFTL